MTQWETILAFDFGEQRLGVAVGNGLVRVAQPLMTVHATDRAQRFAEISQLIAQWRPQRLVVGIARATDGSAHDMTRRCERFANQLHGRFGLPVERVDERYTSVCAESVLKEAGRMPKRTARGADSLDAVAAALILQAWFEQPHEKDAAHA